VSLLLLLFYHHDDDDDASALLLRPVDTVRPPGERKRTVTNRLTEYDYSKKINDMPVF
jgi:hypothetical protein